MTASQYRCALAIGAAIVATSGLLLCGCKLGPDYRRPDTKAPANYRFASGADAASLADAGWWQVYQDTRLQQLIREALANNLDIRIAAARVDQARAVLGATRLQQLPKIARVQCPADAVAAQHVAIVDPNVAAHHVEVQGILGADRTCALVALQIRHQNRIAYTRIFSYSGIDV